MKIQWLSFGIFVCSIVACRSKQTSEFTQINTYLKKEVNNRLAIYAAIPSDSLMLPGDLVAVDRRVQELILLSKDLENLGASVGMANRFFEQLALKYDMESSIFLKLNTLMHLYEVEKIIRQNELSLLNHFLLNYSKKRVPLVTVP